MASDKPDSDSVTKELPKTKLPELFELVDKNKNKFIDILKAAVSIPSVSHKSESFPDVLKMMNWCKKELENIGFVVEMLENKELSVDGVILPPVLLASLFVDDQLRTICVYGHVARHGTDDGWKTNPFELTMKNGRLYGRGASDNKGPLTCWFNALKIYQTTRTKLPVNIKFIIEGTSEIQSPGLQDILWRKQEFFSDVEYVCCTIDKKLQEAPCLIYGYRGVCHFSLDINCGDKMVDSGTYGGTFNQPLIDATNVIGSLIDKHGKIAVPEILKDVAQISLNEKKLCEEITFDLEKIKTHTGAKRLQHREDDVRLIMHKTRLPSITVHSFDHELDPDDKEVLRSVPNRTVAKFSIRIVPNQTPAETYQHLHNYIQKVWNRYKSQNQYSFKMDLGINCWRNNPFNAHYQAAAAAIELLYHTKPRYFCHGYTVPAVAVLQFICTGGSILVLPLSGHDDMLHSNSESISEENYLNGIKMVMSYMCFVFETK